MKFIDINCDLGENYEDIIRTDDAALMPWVSSCNIACGFHGGDPITIQNALELAKKHNVKVGAHPSYPDRENFGRLKMAMSGEILQACVEYQITTLKSLATIHGINLHHVKPHGALYNAAFDDEVVAKAIVAAVEFVDKELLLYCQPGSALQRIAIDRGITTKAEGFGDRSYQATGQLTPRSAENAILNETEQVCNQVLQLLKEESVTTLSGETIEHKVDTICIHGDHANSIEILKALTPFLEEHGLIRRNT